MRKLFPYNLLLILVLFGCEDVYNPEIEEVENAIVADARIVYGQENNYINLYSSVGYYEPTNEGDAISGATVTLINSEGNEFDLPENGTGSFLVNVPLEPQLEYRLKIQHNGMSYESPFESVPLIPELDTVYGIPETLIVQTGGTNNVDDFERVLGVRLHADIPETEKPYYRFDARKILEYTYVVEIGIPGGMIIEKTVHCWDSYSPAESFNLASPPEYSNSKQIIKHPLYFLAKSYVPDQQYLFRGWILELDQYIVSKSAFDYYDDLNKQLESDGKLFDPLYVQARSNLKCTTDSEKLILGNFEISACSRTQYFVKFISEEEGYLVRKLEKTYDIPTQGEQVGEAPAFWQYP